MWRVLGTLSKESYDRQYSDRELLRRLIPYIGAQKKFFVLSILFSACRAIASLVTPLFFAIVFEELVRLGTSAGAITGPTTIWLFSGFYVLFLVLEWVFSYFNSVNKQKLQSNTMYALRHDLFKRVNQHELQFFDRNKTGLLMARISGDAFQVGSVMNTVVDFVEIVMFSVVILGAMFAINWQLTALAALVFPLLFAFIFVLRKYLRRYSLLQRRAEAAVNSATEEYIRGVQVTKSFGQEQRVQRHYEALQSRKASVNARRFFVFRSFPEIIDFFTAIALFIFLVGGGIDVLRGGITPGILYLFITYIRRLFQPLVQLGTFYATLQGGFAAAERMFSLMDVEVSVKAGGQTCPPLKGRIEFRNVFFAYSKKKGDVIRNLSLDVPPGELLAIVGETGAGKTTLASLLARFYEYQEGEILVDGIPINRLDPDSLRDQLGYVLQDPFLFTGTIRENLLLGAPGATRDDIDQAVKAVRANTFIKTLPGGLDATVLEQGRNLSQGQKQLLALARVLLKDPAILILDEATASVDAYTEKMIQDALERVFEDRTTIVIAHRLSTVLNADRIIVMDNGRIVEEGTHVELIRREGRYRELYKTYYAHQGMLEPMA
ncbi:ATP-binding cassette domain-containing protein [Candidatus Bathyarchaeota archaeon]|nr:ATP-binding cassette domain-containing protein [Candidatus Bathyarchaeota archaeon]